MEVKAVTILVVLAINAFYTPVRSICMDYDQYLTTRATNTSIIDTECIDWSSSNITSLANDTFSKFTNLHLVNLSDNLLVSLPEGLLDRQRHLTELDISKNRLQSLPIRLFQDKENLKVVDFSHNRLKFVSSEMFLYPLPNLRHLYLQYNFLTSMEPWGMNNTNYPIHMIDLRFNNISDITNALNFTYEHRRILGNEEKAYIDLRYNSFTTWRDRFMTQFRPGVSISVIAMELLVDFRENHWICDCNIHNLVKEMDSAYIKWAFPDMMMLKCAEPESLKGKKIFYEVAQHAFVCNISDNCPQDCLCQENPELQITIIDCRNTGLTTLPESLPYIKYQNIAMMLDHNNITKLTNRSYTHFISHISVAHNKLTSVSSQFIDDITETNGAFIDLRGNYLTALPDNTQKIPLRNIRLEENELVCSCDMLWMVGWINVEESQYVDRKSLWCEYKGKHYVITDLTAEILDCRDTTLLTVLAILGVVIVIVLIAFVTVVRCPYETKVLLFRFFRFHPADKYIVDKVGNDNIDTDIVISFDETDPYVVQWLYKVLLKKLEKGKPVYSVALPARDCLPGSELESRAIMIESSRRVLVVFSADYEYNELCQYESNILEMLQQSEGRIVYILYDKTSAEKATDEPWKSRMSDRKVFHVGERLFWDKLRYELPQK